MIRHLDTKPEVMARIEKGLRKQKQSERMDTLHDIVRSYVAAHQPVTRELQAVLPISHGELPDDLRGVLYRNGPGRFGNHGQTYGHLMDGDGMVVRFAIGGLGSDGRPCIRYRNSYVRTTEFVYEQRAGRLLYRNFGTQRSGGFFGNLFRTHLKNVANTNVIYHHGRLFALWEGGLPHLLDPVTLDTLERYDFFGALKNRGPLLERVLLPELPFSAHPKEDPQTGDLYNFGVYFGPHPKVLLYAVRQGVALTVTREIPLPAPLLSHDFLLTPHWQILFLFPVSLRILPTLMGQPPSYGMREIEGRAPESVRAGNFLERDACVGKRRISTPETRVATKIRQTGIHAHACAGRHQQSIRSGDQPRRFGEQSVSSTHRRATMKSRRKGNSVSLSAGFAG